MRSLRIILIVTLAMVLSSTSVLSEQPIRMLKSSPKAPPEFQKMEKEARVKRPKPNTKQLTKEELKQILRGLPGGKEKLEKIDRGYKPTSSLIGNTGLSLSSLNPFNASEALALEQQQQQFQSQLPTPYSVYLTREKKWSSPLPLIARAVLNWLFEGPFHDSSLYPTLRNLFRSNKFGNGYISLYFLIPRTDYYILDIYASGYNSAKLEWSGYIQTADGAYSHQTVVLENWDFRNSPNFWNHYTSLQYYQQGWHYIYWYPVYENTTNVNVMSITMYSY